MVGQGAGLKFLHRFHIWRNRKKSQLPSLRRKPESITIWNDWIPATESSAAPVSPEWRFEPDSDFLQDQHICVPKYGIAV